MLASVVIPVHNGADFIAEAVASALGQHFDDFEVLVCDNSSTDRTLDVLDSFGHISNLRVISFTEYVGMPENLNRGFDLAHGHYVRFLCHDDVLESNCLSATVSALEAEHAACLATSYETSIGSRSFYRGEQILGGGGVVTGSRILDSVVRHGNWIGGPSAVTIRKSAVSGRLFDPSLSCSFDIEGWLRLTRDSSLVVVPEVLFHSRIHLRQASRRCERGGFDQDWGEVLTRILGSTDSAGLAIRLLFALARSRLRYAYKRIFTPRAQE